MRNKGFGGIVMATAVICEFNPFHNGHKYLLESAKNVLKEPVIAIMSGSFTQRGEVAVCDKFVRAKSALENGADLVLNCPLYSHFRGLRALQRQVLRLRRLLTAQIILLSAVKAVTANCSKNPQTLFVMKGYSLLCVTE